MGHGRAAGILVSTEDLTHVGMVSHHSLAHGSGVAACLTAHQSFSRDDLLWHDSDI